MMKTSTEILPEEMVLKVVVNHVSKASLLNIEKRKSKLSRLRSQNLE
jgi:hypothetical protein